MHVPIGKHKILAIYNQFQLYEPNCHELAFSLKIISFCYCTIQTVLLSSKIKYRHLTFMFCKTLSQQLYYLQFFILFVRMITYNNFIITRWGGGGATITSLRCLRRNVYLYPLQVKLFNNLIYITIKFCFEHLQNCIT